MNARDLSMLERMVVDAFGIHDGTVSGERVEGVSGHEQGVAGTNTRSQVSTSQAADFPNASSSGWDETVAPF